MRVRNIQRRAGEDVELQMTPMIDIVFLLLVFFIMTFKIAAPEGDFNIKMPLVAPASSQIEPIEFPPITVKMTAHSNGSLDEVRFGNQMMREKDPFGDLRQQVIKMVGEDIGTSAMENVEVELDCDPQLKYAYVMDAITAVSGYVITDEGPNRGQIVKLIEKIKFAPRDALE
jgi:biopolymer transport protein ExbD